MRIQRRLLRATCSLGALVAVAHTTCASAQEAQSTAEQAVADGDIIVTAERRETLVSKTPITMSVLSPEALRNSNVADPTTLGTIVPNLQIDRWDGLQVTLRGVSSNDRTERGETSVPILMDGVYIARRQFSDVGFYDVARVEVLRGPQGTLYGRNTTGGVVNIITNKPKHEVQGGVNLTYGTYHTAQVEAFANLPVSDDLAIRMSGNFRRRDSYLNRAFTTPFGANPAENNFSFRLQTLYNPTDRISILVRGDYNHLGGNPNDNLPFSNFFGNTVAYGDSPNAFVVLPRDNVSAHDKLTAQAPYPIQGRSDREIYGIDAEIKVDMGAVEMTYLPSYKKFSSQVDQNILFGTTNFGRTDRSAGLQNSQEVRFATTGDGPLKLQVGGNYFLERNTIELCLLGLAGPYLCFDRPLTRTESVGAFGQATYSLTPELRVTAGVRYSRDHKTLIDGSTRFQQTAVFDPQTDTSFLVNSDRTWSKVTWRAGLDFDASSTTLLYANVATGYKSGSFNDGVVGQTADSQFYYNPESLTAYEVGMKTRLFDGMLRLNAAAYLYDYNDQQLTFTGTFNGVPATVTTNAGTSRIQGIEVDGTFRPSENHALDFAVTYLDAKYTRYEPNGTGANPSLDGYPLDRSPKFTLSAGYTFTQPLANGGRIEAAVRTKYSDSYVFLVIPSGSTTFYRQPNFTKTNANITYHSPDNKYYVQAFGTNLENEITVAQVNSLGWYTAAEPRVFGVRVGVKY